MAGSDNLRISDVGSSDVDACLLLSDEANWNQVDDDWRLFLRHGKVVGFRDKHNQLIASAAALPYESKFGFISMVLVTEKWRRRGLATRLVDYCIEWLGKRKRIPVLDATAAGANVYHHQGFNPLYELQRWQTNSARPSGGLQEQSSKEVRLADLQNLVRLDGEVAGAERAFLIHEFFARNNVQAFITGKSDGFIMIRPGRRAFQIGPLVARSQNEAIELFSRALKCTKEAIFVDVPTKSARVNQYLADSGFTIQRSFMRMALGRTRPFGASERLFSSAGPEFG